MDGRQHHNWEVSRLVRRRGHLRSREGRGREKACFGGWSGAGNNQKPCQTAPIPCQRDIGGIANRIKQVSTSLGLLGILLVQTPVLTSSAADSSNTQRNTAVLSIEAREYIDVYLHVAVPPSNVPPARFLVQVPRPDTRPLIGSVSSRRPPKHQGRYHHVPGTPGRKNISFRSSSAFPLSCKSRLRILFCSPLPNLAFISSFISFNVVSMSVCHEYSLHYQLQYSVFSRPLMADLSLVYK